MAANAAARGRGFVIVLAPIHPELRIEGNRSFPAALGTIPNATIVDATRLLDDPDFSDAVHPNSAGARKLSAFIGAHLR